MAGTDCSAYTCQIDTKPFTTADKSTYKASHSWDLNLEIDGNSLFDLHRSFEVKTIFSMSYNADFLIPQQYNMYAPCTLTSSGSISPSFSESVYGSVAKIIYADIENSVYLLRRHTETISSSCKYQNPFHYMQPYGTADSVAYFITLTKTVTISYELIINGEMVWSKSKPSITSEYRPQPIVWPMPASQSRFFLEAAEYSWLNDTFFYWYNDPTDLGWFPCSNGSSASLGMTGYEKAFSDGGKDFFYAPWLRDFAFVGVPPFHNLIRTEATERFTNYFGGNASPECAAAFEKSLNIDLWVSQDIVGNYQRYADNDFYSFYLPEIKEAINSVGNQEITDAFLNAANGATTCYPIGLL